MYLDKINKLLDTYTPLKRINKYKLKFKSKPQITLGLQKSISVKNKLLTNFINKDPILKTEFHTNYKKYRNLLYTLMKKSKQAYYMTATGLELTSTQFVNEHSTIWPN